MRVLVVGGGGREHALCAAIAKSPRLTRLFAAPGNPGIAALAECVDLPADNLVGLERFAREQAIDLTVVGPEAPLVAGIVDRFQAAGLRVFGPTAAAARLEGSKAFAKELLRRQRIPTASFAVFDKAEAALQHVRDLLKFPVVIKADGLAAGKGVVICRDRMAAEAAVRELMVDAAFGAAGRRVVIEEFLMGTEASVLAIVDGRTIAILEAARDHKAALDYDRGPNTGGMGAISPPRAVTPEVIEQVERQILIPVVHAMGRSGHPFRGLLYAGLMLTKGGPKVIEFNVRFGDPEAQAILPRLRSDLLEILDAATDGRLDQIEPLDWDPRPACCVVLASAGYPGAYETGFPILGLNDADSLADVAVYHAGTVRRDGQIITNGGRVLGVTALGDDLREACARAYRGVTRIRFQGAFYRSDIGRSEYEARPGAS